MAVTTTARKQLLDPKKIALCYQIPYFPYSNIAFPCHPVDQQYFSNHLQSSLTGAAALKVETNGG